MGMRETGGRAAAFVRSLALLGVLLVGVPAALIAIARARFGGASPLHGVPPPSAWSFADVREAVTDRIPESTIADIVVRAGLLVGWFGAIVLLTTVAVEAAHMARHGGLAMPDVRGLGFVQRGARVIAAGLLVVTPVFTRPAPGAALPLIEPAAPTAERTATIDHLDRPEVAVDVRRASPPSPAPPGAPPYVVVAGDSIYGIAERIAGPDPAAVAAYADALLDLNLGREMADGHRFTNAGFIDVGWELRLPEGTRSVPGRPAVDAATHVVADGESLWSIAAAQLADGARWTEIFEANRGRTFADGAALTDPDLIRPGWELVLPAPAPRHVDPPAVEERPTTDGLPVTAEDPVEPAVVDEPPTHDALPASTDVTDRSGPPGVEHVPARRENRWHPPISSDAGATYTDARITAAGGEAAGAGAVTGVPAVVPAPIPRGDAAGQATGEHEAAVPELLSFSRAAMFSAGVLALLTVRRRAQLRRARPRTVLPSPPRSEAATERALRSIGAGERFARVDVAIRAAALDVIDHGQRVLAVLVSPDGALELIATGRVVLPPPWEGQVDRWELAATIPLEMLATEARKVAAPTPALVQIGTTPEGRDVYVDLEALGALEVGGPGDRADAIVAGIAASLAGSVLAEVTNLIGVGVPEEAFLDHRLYAPASDVAAALDMAAGAVGSTALQGASTFELRARVSAGETWDPAIVLIGSSAGAVPLAHARAGVAVVAASPIHGPSSRLAPDGDAWQLLPAGIRLTPLGLDRPALTAIAGLLDVGELAAGDDTIEPPDDTDEPREDEQHPPSEPPWSLVVRLFAAVEVESITGERVGFERSKTRELVAWLATHRERATRTGARTALWELDVRDATFSNVVSEARRALARLVEPPDGEEWVGRTMTDALPLHRLVVTDADLLAAALEAARVQPPALAIDTLAPAVARIEGMPFEGTSYLWPDAEGITSNLVLLATSATAELAAHCLSLGDVQGVFDATGRGLRVLAGHEELIGLRMRAHALTGDHAGVRQEWASYERVITADPWSDGEPSPKLVQLRRQLLGTNPA